jgi:hypothetical protein
MTLPSEFYAVARRANKTANKRFEKCDFYLLNRLNDGPRHEESLVYSIDKKLK